MMLTLLYVRTTVGRAMLHLRIRKSLAHGPYGWSSLNLIVRHHYNGFSAFNARKAHIVCIITGTRDAKLGISAVVTKPPFNWKFVHCFCVHFIEGTTNGHIFVI